MRFSAGPVSELPHDRCLAVADGRAVVAIVDQSVVAFANNCLHQEAPLAGGYVRAGVLMCPLHFWRYRLIDGSHIGSDESLESYPVEVVDGEVFIDLPDPPPVLTMREKLLAHARDWESRES